MTALYYTFFDERICENLFAEKVNTLPGFFKEKTNRFLRWQDAHASVIGKFLLLKGFKEFGVSASLEDLKFSKYGKPCLTDSSISFNISHSGNYVVCIMTNEVSSVGVDIELIRPVNIFDFKTCWTEAEWNEIVNGDPELFYTYWTRKEAVLKSDGRGLGIPLNNVDVSNECVHFNDSTYFIQSYDLENYAVHSASLKRLTEVHKINILMRDLF